MEPGHWPRPNRRPCGAAGLEGTTGNPREGDSPQRCSGEGRREATLRMEARPRCLIEPGAAG